MAAELGGLMRNRREVAGDSEPEVARAIPQTDIILLEGQISRFGQKRDYWRIRTPELAGNGRRVATH